MAVTIEFDPVGHTPVFLRLVLGGKGLSTAIRSLADRKNRVWELMAIAPSLEDYVNNSSPFSLSVEALDEHESLLDAVSVGSFTYRSAPNQRSEPPLMSWNPSRQRHRILKDSPHTRPIGVTATTPKPYSIPINKNPMIPRSSTVSNPISRRPEKVCLVPAEKRRKIQRSDVDSTEDRPLSREIVLDITETVSAVCTNWTSDEIEVGRRLIQFAAVHEDQQLRVTCSRIEPDEYKEGNTAVSCIYCKDSRSCFVTSVDIITVVESLVGRGFELEEKNRIRRNLEGFRPKTISKHRAGSESFFQQIMAFPPPRPRNIEKDVKVFDWKVLPLALEKILPKYSPFSFSQNEDVPVAATKSAFPPQPFADLHSPSSIFSDGSDDLFDLMFASCNASQSDMQIEPSNDFMSLDYFPDGSPSTASSLSSLSSFDDPQGDPSGFLYTSAPSL